MSGALVDGIGIGTAKGALKALLTSPAFASMLTTIAARYGDGVELRPLEAVYTSEVAPDKMSYPCAWLLGPDTVFDQDSQVPAGRHTVLVIFWVLGDDPETITAQIERYVEAFVKLAWDPNLAPEATSAPFSVVRAEYGQIVGHVPTQRLLKGAEVEVFLDGLDT